MSKHTTKPTAFPDRLRAWRASKQLTRQQAADAFGIKLKRLEKWEQGEATEHAAVIVAITERLIADGF